MPDLGLDAFDVRIDGRRMKRLILLRLKQLAAKMHGDDGEVRSYDGKHSLHGNAGAVL